jgi:hypothetical protein
MATYVIASSPLKKIAPSSSGRNPASSVLSTVDADGCS